MSRAAARQADIVRILRSRVVRGIYAGKVPSGRILAKELGANVTTINLALAELRSLGIVRREARQGTFVVPPDQREKSGTVMAARLVCQTPFSLDRSAFWQSAIIYGFEQGCVARGLPMVLHYSAMGEEADEVVAYALNAGASGHCVGTCLLGPIVIRQALTLRQAAAPVVAVDWEFEEPIIPSVSFDDLEAGALIAKHLFSLGHRRIAFVEHLPGDPAMRDRAAGAEKVLAAFGLPPMQRIPAGDDWPVLSDRILSASPRPTAVITWIALLADFLISRAAAAGIRVPQDLSVASFYDPRFVTPKGLTVAALDFEALGRRALEALLDDDLWRNPAPRLVPVDRVVGHTTAPPPSGG